VRYGSGERELTDLVADPTEQVNLACDSANDGTLRRLESLLLKALLSTGARWPEQIAHA
jgi:hypothetical protein